MYTDKISIHGIIPGNDIPGNVSDVHRFLGMTNRLSKFIPNLADKTKPLTDLLRNDQTWTWKQPQQEAFDRIKE